MKHYFILAVVLVVPLAAVAQATSTDAVASTTSVESIVEVVRDTPATTTEATSTQVTLTPEVVDVPTMSQDATTTASTNIPTLQSVVSDAVSVEAVSELERVYFDQHGTYLQILPGNQLPEYETGTVESKLGSTVHADIRVDVYEAPEGRGYQVSYMSNGVFHSVGYGPEAATRTFTYELSVASSSQAL